MVKDKRFKLIYTIKRDRFYELKKLSAFEGKVEYNKIRIELYLKSKKKVNMLENNNFISKWWNDYKILKDLTDNYTYLDIDVEFYEDPKDSLVRVLTNATMYQMKRDGII